MRCPECQKEVSSSARNCYYCGAALPSTSAQSNSYVPTQPAENAATPKTVPTAHREFVKSPIMLLAILAYTIFAVILLIKSFPALEYIDECIDVIDESFTLFVTLISAMFLFVAPLIISIGLWTMYSSEGIEGATLVHKGISTYIGLNIGALAGSCLFVLFNGDPDSFGKLFLPLAFGIFGLVATHAMHCFVDGVEYSALSGKANTDGVMRAGVLLLIHLGITLITILDVIESLELGASMLGDSNNTLETIANIAHLLALALFGICALTFCSTMERAEQVDRELERQTKKQGVQIPAYQAKPYSPVQAVRSDDSLALLKQYKELLDTGVITQEDYDAKKKQLLGL